MVIFDGRRRGATRSLKSNPHGRRAIRYSPLILDVLFYITVYNVQRKGELLDLHEAI